MANERTNEPRYEQVYVEKEREEEKGAQRNKGVGKRKRDQTGKRSVYRNAKAEFNVFVRATWCQRPYIRVNTVI